MTGRKTTSRSDPDQITEPSGYVSWPADQKLAWLWHTLILSTSYPPAQIPSLRMPFQTDPRTELAIVTRRAELSKVLTRTSDLMEPGRPKVIHALGAVACVELETAAGSPCTGLLAPAPNGGATGLIRMSLVAKVSAKAAFTPGFGLKFLISHAPSADVLAMNHTVGQGRDFDLFSNSMTNDLSDEHSELRLPQKIMSVLFDRVSRHPRRLVLRHVVGRHRDGSAVTAPVEPRRLVFEPTIEAKQIFRGQAGVDFRLVLAGVGEGTPLYQVDAVTHDGGRTAVGVVRTTTTFVASVGGDRLFFRHEQDPADRKP